MKYLAVVLLALGLVMTSCSKKSSTEMKTLTDSVSYVKGLDISIQLKQKEADINLDLVAQAIKDGKDTSIHLLTDAQIMSILTNYNKQALAKMSTSNKAESDKYFAECKTKPGVVVLPSGLQYEVMKMGSGPKPKADQVAILNVVGTFIDGTEFYNTTRSGQPAMWPVSQMFKGATEALLLMPVGSKWKVSMPASLAFGERGDGNQIPPNKTLIFVMELLDTKPMPTGPHGAGGSAQGR